MPTTVSREELDELGALINDHIEQTGESVTSMSERSGVSRTVLSQLRSGNYRSSPQLDAVKKVGACIGKRLTWVDAAPSL